MSKCYESVNKEIQKCTFKEKRKTGKVKYVLGKGKASWRGAREACQEMNGDFTTIHHKTKHD